MMKHYIYALLIICMTTTAKAQNTSLRGMYIDHFSSILGNTSKEDSLLHYAQDSSFNYLALYTLGSLNLSSSATANSLAAFIKRAREQFGVTYVGAVCENFATFRDDIAPYNNNRADDNERFNVFNLEFEFWTTSSVSPGGYYCTRYLQGANCSCDTSGGFKFFIEQMHKIDSLAAVQQVISETYLGWFNQGQGAQIQRNADRILLHAYRTNTSSLFSYSKTRMQYLASNNTPVDIAPIFSAEPNFMGPWLETHGQGEAYDQYKSDFDSDNSTWKQYVNILGYQWFDWKYMPRPVQFSFSPTIAASGPLTFCSGNSVTLTATTGDAYSWSNGATTRSITLTAGGSFTCDVTLNSVTHTTPTTTVTVKSIPTVSVSSANLTGGQITLTANASPGTGSISGYQWKRENTDISGAESSSFVSVISGGYTVRVTNSAGCSNVSALQNVSISNNCSPSTPNGLTSDMVTQVSEILHWAPAQTGDTLVLKYQADTSSNSYTTVRMFNVGQSAHILNNLHANTTYGWMINTVCGSSAGSNSVKSFFTTGVSTNIPGPPDPTADAGNMGLNIFPNPVGEKLNISFTSGSDSKGEVILMDINSKIIFTEKMSIHSGENNLQINSSQYGNGVYFLSMTTDDAITVKKFVISH